MPLKPHNCKIAKHVYGIIYSPTIHRSLRDMDDRRQYVFTAIN